MATEALEQDIEKLVEAVHVLASDVRAAAHLSEHADTAFGRRAYVRAAFALVEGNTNLMADVILRAYGRAEVPLSDKELELLRQERITTDSDGTPVVRLKFVPLRDRIAPVIRMFSRLFGKNYCLDKSGSGWVALCTAIEIRNRITHPKDAVSFRISDSDLDIVERARGYFADSIESLLNDCD